MKRLVSLLLVLCVLLTGTVCFAEENIELKGTATVNWNDNPVQHGNFTDLGDNIIDLGVIDQEAYEKGLSIVNSKVDIYTTACTGIVKRNSKGEVIMGRNMDLEVSNNAAFIAHFVGGKYQAIGFGYNNHSEYSYADIQAMDNLPDGYREMQAAAAMDAFNEAGLYIQTNMRTGNGHLSSGTNPGGKRVCMGALNAIIAQNCATVAEALEFIRTELDVYSPGATSDGAARAGWDGAFMIGDATGEYGVVEFVNNQMYYTPYANGHGNAYVNPNLYIYNEYCAGFGRLALAQQAMVGAETADDMMEAIHMADWRREIEDIKYSYKDEQGNVHFVDKDGNPSIDYRTELTMMLCVDDDGNYIPSSSEWIQYLTSLVTGEAFSFLDSTMYNLYELDSADDSNVLSGLTESLQKFAFETLEHYHSNCNVQWLTNNDNFEQVKQAFIDYFTNLNAFELLEKFAAGDEQPLRDSGEIFTTGMNFGVNCTQKYLKVRFLEQASCVYEYQW